MSLGFKVFLSHRVQVPAWYTLARQSSYLGTSLGLKYILCIDLDPFSIGICGEICLLRFETCKTSKRRIEVLKARKP